MAALTLALTAGSLLIVVPPLGIRMDNLLNRNQVYLNLSAISRSTLPAGAGFQMTNLSVRIRQDAIHVGGDIAAPRECQKVGSPQAI